MHHAPERTEPTKQEYHASGVSAENTDLNLHPSIPRKNKASEVHNGTIWIPRPKKLNELTINLKMHFNVSYLKVTTGLVYPELLAPPAILFTENYFLNQNILALQ